MTPTDVTLRSGRSPRLEGRIAVGAAFLILLGVACIPLFLTVLPPLVDYPNHLARLDLIAEGGNAFFRAQWAPLPDLAADLVVPGLMRLGVPLALAGKLFLAASFVLTAGGVVWLNRAVTGRWRLWPLLAFLLLYNRSLLWGFINYLFGLGLAICGVALWLALEDRRGLRMMLSVPVALACFFSHLAAFGIYALAIAGVELPPLFQLLRARRYAEAVRRAAGDALQAVIPAMLLLAFTPASAAGSLGYGALWRKADLLFSVFDNYNRPFDAIGFALFIGLLGLFAWRRQLIAAPRLGSACAVLAVAYLMLPNRVFSGYGADHRLPVALFAFLIAAGAPSLPRRGALLIGSTAAALLVIRMAVIETVWRTSDRIYAADIAALDSLPAGAKLAVAYPASEINAGGIPELHVATLAAARRGAFVPTVFAYASQQPLALRPPFDALAAATSPTALWAAFTAGDAAAAPQAALVLQNYDFIVFASRAAFDVPPRPCLRPMPSPPNFRLFAIDRQARCF